ncbi:MAG: complex I subunit 1 family protein [Pseudomonadota bacterium]
MSNLQNALDQLIAAAHCPFLNRLPIELVYLIGMVLAATVLIFGIGAGLMGGFSTYVERRVAGRMQARVGCNRVGPEGLLQFLADGIKLILKEDMIPRGADRFLFRVAPYVVFAAAALSFVTIPFGPRLFAADLNVGLLYLIAVSSFVVVGVLLAGWASNNKWSLLGAMRSAAQIVSYEIPVGLALMIPVLLAGSMSLQDLNAAQAGGARHWFLFSAFPGPFIAFFVYFIAALAEVNRIPFDLPEAESELVSGYNTEYSGIRWGIFYMGEYANMFLISAIAVTAFLGGWQPSRTNYFVAAFLLFFAFFFVAKSVIYLSRLIPQLLRGKSIFSLLSGIPFNIFSRSAWIVLAVLSLAGAFVVQAYSEFWAVTAILFLGKVYFFVFVIIWLRWTLPRYRIDQMMDLCWKKLVPIAFVCLLWTAGFMLLRGTHV